MKDEFRLLRSIFDLLQAPKDVWKAGLLTFHLHFVIPSAVPLLWASIRILLRFRSACYCGPSDDLPQVFEYSNIRMDLERNMPLSSEQSIYLPGVGTPD